MGRITVNKGDVFGNFTVIREVAQKGNTRRFLFKCVCGNEGERSLGQVKGLFTKSCGCMKVTPDSTTHGMSKTRLYRAWRDMKNRCLNPNTTGYSNYGGRGIKVCKEWMKFEPFMKWAMSNGYRKALSLERVDVNGNYNPDNCKWIPFSEQASNKRNVNLIEIDGVTKTMAEWCRIYNVPIGRVIARKKYGWDLRKAILTPPNPPKRKVNYAS